MDSTERLKKKLTQIKGRQDQWLNDDSDAELAMQLILDDVSWLIGYVEAVEKFG